ncbi:histidine kinase [Neobacillus rhizosphaerae]|uniref:sensor histidine kinase n=1 Tax=Neobacillus rhizosphaerae TaxID=2880965 RepID=UPI003D2C2104
MMFSIRYKLTILLLAAILLPIVTSILITHKLTKSSITEKVIEGNSKLLFQGKTNLENYLQSIDNTTQSALFSRTSYRLFDLMRIRTPKDQEKNNINLSITQLGDSKKEFHQVFLFLDRQKQSYLYTDYVSKQAMLDFKTEYNERAFIEPTHLSHDYGFNQRNLLSRSERTQVFSFYRIIEDVPLKDRLGVLSIDVRLDYLRFISNMLYTDKEEDILILDQDGNVIYSSQEKLIGTKVHAPWVDKLFRNKKMASHFEVNQSGSKDLILYDTINLPYANWKLVKKIPYSWLYHDANLLTKINTFVVICFLILAISASLLIVIQTVVRPIRRLIYEMNIVERGEFNVQFPNIDRKDEFGVLSRRFHQMVDRINSLILSEYKLEIANKTNQLKALQAQINPHFFNNVLQSIGTLALKNKNFKIYSLTSALGRMMHFNMKIDESIIPLGKEIDYIKSYLELQQQRFEDDFQLIIDIDESTLPIQVPKMILQPIIENYFVHGRFDENNQGVLKLTTKLESNEQLILIVEDNGQGISDSKMKELTDLLREKNDFEWKSTDHIGLLNVLTRLRVYYSPEVKMILEHVVPHGLKITTRIPLHKGGDPEKNEGVNR